MSYRKRLDAASQWCKALETISEHVNVPMVNEVLRTISPEQGVTVSEPSSQGDFWGLKYKSTREALSLTPLLKQDEQVHPYFKRLVNSRLFTYRESENSIYFSVDTIPPILGGFVLLHEGVHAAANRDSLWRHFPGRWGHWLEETKAYETEFKTMRQYIGKDYDRAVIRHAAEIHNTRHEGIKMLPVSKDDISVITAKLGIKMTQNTSQLLSSLLRLQSVFFIFDNGFELSDDISNHANYIHWTYNSPPKPLFDIRLNSTLAICSK